MKENLPHYIEVKGVRTREDFFKCVFMSNKEVIGYDYGSDVDRYVNWGLQTRHLELTNLPTTSNDYNVITKVTLTESGKLYAEFQML